jgi:hypothetical protein
MAYERLGSIDDFMLFMLREFMGRPSTLKLFLEVFCSPGTFP